MESVGRESGLISQKSSRERNNQVESPGFLCLFLVRTPYINANGRHSPKAFRQTLASVSGEVLHISYRSASS